jgi:trimeric autotransporter adhesin
MSTKTTFKRIALVAVASLGFGMVSTVPSFAADAEVAAGTVTALNVKKANANTYVAASTQTIYVGTTTAVEAAPAADALFMTFRAAMTTFPTGGFIAVSPSNAGTLDLTGAGTDTVSGDSIVYQMTDTTAIAAETISATGTDGVVAFTSAPTVPGDYVMTIWHDRDGGSDIDLTEARQTVAFTIVAGAGFSAGLSTSIRDSANSFDATVDEEVRVSKSAGTDAASIEVTIKDTTGAALGGMRVSAEVSGPGLVDVVTGLAAAYGDATVRADALTLAAGVSGATVHVTADGTGGTGTITIKVQDATTLATLGTYTETVYFYGTVATLEAKANYTIARASATERGCASATTCDRIAFADTPFVEIVAKDADGNLVPGLTVTATISNPAVLQASTVAAVTSTVVSGADALTAGISTDTKGLGWYNASVAGATTATSGSSATIKYETTVAGTTTVISSNAVTLTIGGSAATGTTTVALDKASYEGGEGMTVTLTAKDSAGNPVYDGFASPAVSFNKATGGTAVAASFFVAGKVTSDDALGRKTIYAPTASGAFTATATASSLATITATATVSDDAATAAGSAAADAAAEATDAANAATDAANAAAEAADAATAAAQDAADAVAALSASVATMVSDLKKQITSLTNLVIKIQKKVRA